MTQIQTPSIVEIIPRRSITEYQIWSDDYLWVVAFEKKRNLLKAMALNKHGVIFSGKQLQALTSDFTDLMIDDEWSVLNKNLSLIFVDEHHIA